MITPMTDSTTRPHTLAVDCGGTGMKAIVFDAAGNDLCERVRIRTPYPCPPRVLTEAVRNLAQRTGPPFDRVSVGFPGMVRNGVVLATPHYVTESGPFTPRRDDLVAAWSRYDIRHQLEETLGKPTRVLNDAEIAGLAAIRGIGFEAMFTLGTGFGCALFEDGRVLPKVELSQAPFRKGETFDEQLGHHARRALGKSRWTSRVRLAVDALRPVLWWDHLYVGGGGAEHLAEPLGDDITIVSNTAGLRGGYVLWDRDDLGDAAHSGGRNTTMS